MTYFSRYVFIAVLLYGTALSSSPQLGDFIHPDCGIIESLMQNSNEYLDNALFDAFERLTGTGGEDIFICRCHRIEAPLGGYLIDGLFRLEMNGKNYSTFRIGIEDAEPDTFFTFIARGMDQYSDVIWYPEPGPDYIPQENQVTPESFFTYEFLIDRDEFENLENEFAYPETVYSEG